MAFWNRKRETRADSGMAVPAGWLSEALGARPTSSGQRVTVDRALGLTPVYAAVSIIAEQVGQLPFKVYKQVDGDRVEARTHPAWRLLNGRPNSSTPAGRFWSTVTVHLLLYGNAFIEKVRGPGGAVEELRVLPPSQIGVKWWPKLMDKTFVYTPMDGTPRRELDSSEVLHIMNMSLDGIVGLSVISACRGALGTALARDEFEGVFYERGAVLAGVVTMPGRVRNQEAADRLKAALRVLHGGSAKAHEVAVFEEGVEYKPLSSPLRDLQFVESQNVSRTDIAVMFKLPPNKLGGSSGDSLTYSTVESNQTEIAVNAVAPITHTIAQAVSQDPSILPQNIFEAEFVLEGMMRGDSTARAAFYTALSGVKAIHPDEIRAKENMPALTAAQKKDLNPAPAAPPTAPQNGQLTMEAAMAVANGNGNGGGENG
jgi:HK97 family phage portal protein